MKHIFCFLLILPVMFNCMAQRIVTVKTTPADARIMTVSLSGERSEIGTGTCDLKPGKEPISIVVEKEGYEPVKKSYVKNGSGVITDDIVLKNRIVKITSNIYDAEIYQDGMLIGKGGNENKILVKENSNVSLLAKSPGYLTKTVVYYNMPGQPEPPVHDMLVLDDRAVNVTAYPARSSILSDGVKMGEDSKQVIVPKGTCVTVTIAKEGYAKVEKVYCNKENMPAPPINEVIALTDREVRINTTPENAQIKINGKIVSGKDLNLTIPENQCVDVEVSKEGFDTQKRSYCNSPNTGSLPVTDHISLAEDEAWTSSIQSDQANINFSVSINPQLNEESAWKILSQIILDKFDILEITDRSTGYLRTAWHIKQFSNGTIVRTRVIVKQGNIEPLKYVVKIVSEISIVKNVSASEDENFREWDRLLKTYKDIISEIQARLQ